MRPSLLRVLALAILGGTAVAGACSPFGADENAAPTEPEPEDGDDEAGLNTSGVGAGTGAKTDLPCDVQQLLENRCIGCHLSTSTIPLLSYDELVKPSQSDHSKRVGVVAVERMQSTSKPMPPLPAEPPTAEEIATMQAWVGSNMPRGGVCTPAASAPPDAGVDAAIYDTTSVCTSKTMWSSGGKTGVNVGVGGIGIGIQFGPGGGGGRLGGREENKINASPEMAPGGACLTCHSVQGGPSYQIAGTVYPTAHEPDNCNGVNGGVDVVITDKNGVVTTVPTNKAGNFIQSAKIAAPFHVKVKQGEKERVMATALTAGDCNTCHTEKGANGAPGRIMAP